MTQVRIGPARIADRVGTHEPGDVLDNPSPALLALATSGTVDPETNLPYCTVVGSEPAPAPSKAAPEKP